MATRQALRDSSNLDSPYAKALLSRPKPQRSSRQPRRQICEPPVKPATEEEDEEAYFSVDECPSTPAAAAPENLYDNLEPSAAPVVSVNQQLLSELSGVLGSRRSAKPTESPARRSSTAPGAQASVLANAAAEMVAQRAKKKEAAAEKARAAEAAEAAEEAEAEAAEEAAAAVAAAAAAEAAEPVVALAARSGSA